MFIREYETKNKKTGATYVTHRLVESYRTEKGSRQRIIMHLGTLTIDKSKWKKLAACLEARYTGQISLFEKDPEIITEVAKAIQHYEFTQEREADKKSQEQEVEMMNVDVNSLTFTKSRSLGSELVANEMWKKLSFDEILRKCQFNNKEIALAEAVIVGKLIYPSSDIGCFEWLKNMTSLIEMLPFNLENVGKDSIYEIADKLFIHKEYIESALRNRETKLFPNKETVFLFDLSNTFFEGSCHNNSLAKYGRSKEKRSDCPLVAFALVVDNEGLPVLSQIYKGNQSEPGTLEDILENLYTEGEILFNDLLPTIAMDRGIATKNNIELLKKKKYPYIVIERSDSRQDFIEEFNHIEADFEKIRESASEKNDTSVYVKKILSEETCKVLCYSKARKHKEESIYTLKESRFIEDLTNLQKSVTNGNIKLLNKVYEKIGRIKEKYPSISKYYDIKVIPKDKRLKTTNKKAIAIDVNWKKKVNKNNTGDLAGCYVLETSHKNLTAREIWELYMTLSKVESAFRALKSDLGVRPIYHHSAERTKAHLFISILAYHLLITIENNLKKKDYRKSWETIRKILSTHQRSTAIFKDENAITYNIRSSGMPESCHQEIYKLLDVKDPLKKRRYKTS